MELTQTRFTVAQAAEQVFAQCKHVAPDGTSAYMNIGLYGEGYEQCILCGHVICTTQQDDEYPPARYGL